MSEFVTLVNRTSKTLKGTWDGRHYDMKPGKHQFTRTQAEKFRDQNPIMGTYDKYTGEMKYLIGIEENGEDCSPVEQDYGAITLEDLRGKIASGELRVVQGNGLYGAADRSAAKPLPLDGTGFVKP